MRSLLGALGRGYGVGGDKRQCLPITLIQVFSFYVFQSPRSKCFCLQMFFVAFTMFTNVMLTQTRFYYLFHFDCLNVRSVVYANTDVVGDFTFSRSLAFHGIKV